MNIVFLSPHFPPNWWMFCRAVKETGGNILGIGDEIYDRLSMELKSSLTEYFRIGNMGNYDEVLRACGFLTYKYGKLDRFESHNEHWLETEAKIRDDFNMFGIRTNQLENIKRKSKMKEIFKKAGLKVARGKVIHTAKEALEFVEEVSYPIIAKPDTGVGAIGTFRINNEHDLKLFFDNKDDKDYIVEEFIDGKICTFDGLSDKEANPLFHTSHKYSEGVIDYLHKAHDVNYYSLRKIPENFDNIGKLCLKEFDLKERFFHIEFFEVDKDDYVALEVNARPPGGFTMEMFNFSSDLDLYRIWAELLVHNNNKINYSRKYHTCFLSRRNINNYVHSHEDIIRNFNNYVVFFSNIPGVFSKAMGDYGYIIRSEKFDDIVEIAEFVHKVK